MEQSEAPQPRPPGDNIKVAVRFRPLSENERGSEQEVLWAFSEEAVALQGRSVTPMTFAFDHIFSPSISENRVIFEAVAKDIVNSTLEGFNGTIFAYGQTSAGKTFTMKGTAQNAGIIPCAIAYIFDEIKKSPNRDYNLRCSYLEIYNEVITDLLQVKNTNLKIHESLSSGIFVGNLTEEPICAAEEALRLLERGEEHRHVGVTNINEHSSRSHTIFRMVIESREALPDTSNRDSCVGPLRISSLNFVDLAGSERISATGAEGARLKEGGHINKSLFALTSVISRLSEGKDKAHVPYRDSKLTRILQPSLGGNAKTVIVCALTPASGFIEESLSTLKFASRAKTIKNKAHINEIISDEEQIQRYCEEIRQLKLLLANHDDTHPAKRSRSDLSLVLPLLRQAFVMTHDLKQCLSTRATTGDVQTWLNDLYEEVTFAELESKTILDQFETVSKRCHDMTTEVAHLQELLLESQKDKELASDLAVRYEDLQDSYRALQEESASVEAACRSDIASLRDEAVRLNETVMELQRRLQNSSCQSCTAMAEGVGQLAQAIEVLEKSLSSAPKQSDIDRMEIEFQKRIDTYERQRTVLEESIQSLRLQLLSREQEVGELMESLASAQRVERTLDNKFQSTIDDLLAAKTSLEEKVLVLQSTLDTTLHDRQALAEEREAANQLAEELASKVDSLKRQVAELLQGEMEKDSFLSSLGQRLNLAEGALEARSKDAASAQDELGLKQSLLEEANRIKSGLEVAVQEKEASIQALKDENSQLLKEIVVLQKQLVLQNAEFRAKDTLSEQKDATCAQLTGDLERFKALLEEAGARSALLENELLSVQEDGSKWHAKADSLALELEQIQGATVRHQEETLKHKEETLRHKEENLRLASQLQEALGPAQTRLAELEESLGQSVVQNASLQDTVSRSQSKEVLLRIELEKLRDSFNREKRQLQLRICELEESLSRSAATDEQSGRLQHLEAELASLRAQRTADAHKVEYYVSLAKQHRTADQENTCPVTAKLDTAQAQPSVATESEPVAECKQQ